MPGRIKVGMLLCAASVALASCATAPRFTTAEHVKVESLFYTLEQELCEAVGDLGADPFVASKLREAGVTPDRQFAKATASLKLVRTTDASGEAAMVIPVTSGVASIGFGGGVTREDTVDTSVSVYYPFAELQCSLADPPPRIAGGLGLREWIGATTRSLIRVEETPTAYSYEVSFEVTADGRVNPGISYSTPTFRVIGGELSAGVERAITHTLNVTVQTVAVQDAGRPQRVPAKVRDALDRQESLNALRHIE